MLDGDNIFAVVALSFGMVMVSFDLGESSPVFGSVDCGDSTGELTISSGDGPVAGNLNVCGKGADVPLFANGAPLIPGVFGAVAAPRRAGLSGATPSTPEKFAGRIGEG